jgi:hypothetical protein
MYNKRAITPEYIIEIFRKSGKEVTKEEAQNILEFLYKMAILEVREQLKKKQGNNYRTLFYS